MITTVFLFHPHLEDSRINARLARTARAATTPDNPIHVRDMYALYPDFHINVPTEQTTLTTTDRIVLQFPVYWYSCPPLLKKWEDDILTYGWAYGTNGDALHGKELLIAVSPGAPAAHYTRISAGRRSMTDLLLGRRPGRDESVSGYRVTDLLRPFQAMSSLVGMLYLEPFVTPGAASITKPDLEARAKAYARYVVSRRIPMLDIYQ